MSRMTGRQQKARRRLPYRSRPRRRRSARRPSRAWRRSPRRRATLRTSKTAPSRRSSPRPATLLSKLTAEEKARLAALERKKEAEASARPRSWPGSRPDAEQARGGRAAGRQEPRTAAPGPVGYRRPDRHGHRRPAYGTEGREGPRLRPRPDRQAVRLGRDRARLLRLLGADPGRLEGGGRLPPAHHLRPGEGRHAGRHGRPASRATWSSSTTTSATSASTWATA